jgi:hypothetical protein
VFVSASTLFARRSWLPRIGGVVVLTALALAVVLNFSPSFTTRIHGAPWSDQIQAAVPECSAYPGATVRLVASPNPARWFVNVPCELIAP